MSIQYCTPEEARSLFASKGEFALLDVREQEEFSRAHMLLASCAPVSRLEMMLFDLVPCKKTPVILVDSGKETVLSRAERAWETLIRLGYENPMILKGGMKGWLDAGYVEFDGVGALSKGFGEYVEEEQQTPRLEPAEVKAVMDSGERFVVIDVRPREEFNNMSIPEGINVPGCEITYRIGDIAPDPDTTIIINCAGRTRSIIGAQTLRNAGLPNKIVALKGGTMNWQLAGYALDYGNTRCTSPPSPAAIDIARRRAGGIAEKYGISFVEGEVVKRWQAEAGEKTLYIFDVRQPEEFTAGHIPGSRSAQGGQLVQATDEYAAVRNGRYVLVDDTEVRAIMTAHWLKQMGLPQVYVLRGGLGGSGFGMAGLERGEPAPSLPPLPEVPLLQAVDVYEKLAGSFPPLVLNVGVSKTHRAGHIPGAVWVTRGYLSLALAAYKDTKKIVITSDNEVHARLAALDAAHLWPGGEVSVLAGGTPAWTAAGLPLEKGMPVALCAEDDVWYKPYTDIHAKPEAMKGYFDWEFGLVEKIRKDGGAHFSLMKSTNPEY
jgi:rhodanese-related sulfurtransferase